MALFSFLHKNTTSRRESKETEQAERRRKTKNELQVTFMIRQAANARDTTISDEEHALRSRMILEEFESLLAAA